MAQIEDHSGTLKFLLSPSDLTSAAICEYGWLRKIDGNLGWADELVDDDALRKRLATLGDTHEARYLEQLKRERQVTEFERPNPYNRETLAEAAEKTRVALLNGDPVVFQGAVFDGTFGGFADFFIKNQRGDYVVVDAKLARRAKVEAIIQIAAYADLLDLISVPRASEGVLYLGNQTDFRVDLDDAIGVYRIRRAHVEKLLTEHLAQAGQPAQWAQHELTVCGTCVHCEAAIAEHDDLFQIAGITKSQRSKLLTSGVTTLQDFAKSKKNKSQIVNRTWSKLHSQARLQADPSLGIEVHSVDTLNTIPEPNPGDIFFDFEGDPMWTDESGVAEGLEYLFGFVDINDQYTSLWAHDRDQERTALIDFFELVEKRWNDNPDFHIYHYASYEVTALKRLTVRHSYGEDFLDDLLRNRVFVDLYSIVRQSLRLPVKSYSIKKLEPFYMGEDLRSDDGVTNATDSMVEYLAFMTFREEGDDQAANEILRGIEDYNRYDCISTSRLRDWLLGYIPKKERRVPETIASEPGERLAELADLSNQVLKGIPATNRTPTEQAIAMIAAAIGFHRREDKPFWWAFFDRMTSEVDEWLHPRGTLISNGLVTVEKDWSLTPRSGKMCRTVTMVGTLEQGSSLKPGIAVRSVYEDFPPGLAFEQGNLRVVSEGGKILEMTTDEQGRDRITFEELLSDAVGFEQILPMAIFEFNLINKTVIENAIETLADAVIEERDLPRDSVSDLLALRPPAVKGAKFNGVVQNGDYLNPLITALNNLDHSYVAVQGPPGTGKTYIGSRAVAHLMNQGWRIGIVAQSHKTVEHFLNEVINTGIAPGRIAKKPKDKTTGPWHNFNKLTEISEFIKQNSGILVGGTTWNFSSPHIRGLDLLVIEEAGQYSLAHTIASSRSANRLLLLGDPQQLPQVTQGTHPEPVDRSALSWLAQNYDTLPATHGFFIERTRRMHSELTKRVSDLSYNSLLYSEENITDTRELSTIEPGLHPVEVEHRDNSVMSVEEAEAVVRIVTNLSNKTWKPAHDAKPRRFNHQDVIVVAPYNAQVSLLRKHLDDAGFNHVRVGTVDKFQGQEAAVAIVSLAASSDADVPRGLEFLLNRNRLNVAISRGQWATYLVYSPALKQSAPTSVETMLQLGAFIRLVS